LARDFPKNGRPLQNIVEKYLPILENCASAVRISAKSAKTSSLLSVLSSFVLFLLNILLAETTNS
jgi:hypothetical protein